MPVQKRTHGDGRKNVNEMAHIRFVKKATDRVPGQALTVIFTHTHRVHLWVTGSSTKDQTSLKSQMQMEMKLLICQGAATRKAGVIGVRTCTIQHDNASVLTDR